mgnify:CR=1 FL=1
MTNNCKKEPPDPNKEHEFLWTDYNGRRFQLLFFSKFTPNNRHKAKAKKGKPHQLFVTIWQRDCLILQDKNMGWFPMIATTKSKG